MPFHSKMPVCSSPALAATAVSDVQSELMQALAVAKRRAESLAPLDASLGAVIGASVAPPAMAVQSDQAFEAPSALQELVAWAEAEETLRSFVQKTLQSAG